MFLVVYERFQWYMGTLIRLYFTLAGRNVWNTNGMTYPPSVAATHKKHWCLKKSKSVGDVAPSGRHTARTPRIRLRFFHRCVRSHTILLRQVSFIAFILPFINIFLPWWCSFLPLPGLP